MPVGGVLGLADGGGLAVGDEFGVLRIGLGWEDAGEVLVEVVDQRLLRAEVGGELEAVRGRSPRVWWSMVRTKRSTRAWRKR